MLGRQLHALAASGLTLLPFAAQPAVAAPPAAQAQSAATPANANRRVVAFIHGNVPIYRDELGDYLISRGGMDKIELLVNRRIIHEAMKQRNLTISTNEIEAGLEYDLRGAKVELDAFIQYIRERYGKSLFEWKQDVIQPRLQLGKMCHKDIVITPEELQKAFDSRFGEKREAQLIVWPKAAAELPAAERGKARSNAMEFEKLAAVQPDQRLAQSHGRVNPVGRNIDGEDPKVEAALFSLKEGEISPWIETKDNWTCVRCLKIIPRDPKLALANVEQEVRQEVYDRKLNAAIPAMFAQLKKEADPHLTVHVPRPANFDPAHPPERIPHANPNVLAVVYGNIEVTREDLGDFIIVRGGVDKLELLVNRRIIEWEAAKRGVVLSPQEIETAKKEYVGKLGIANITVADFVKHVLPKRNLTEFSWVEDVIKPELAMAKMCRSRIKVSDEELRKAFETQFGEKRALKIILWRKDEFRIAEKQWAEARQSDANFDKIARAQYTPGLAAAAGKVAPIGRYPDAENSLIAETVFNLDPNDSKSNLSQLFATPAGIVCVKCVGIVPAVAGASFEKERPGLEKMVSEQKLSKELGVMFAELKQAANPNILLGGQSNAHDIEERNKYLIEQAGGPPK